MKNDKPDTHKDKLKTKSKYVAGAAAKYSRKSGFQSFWTRPSYNFQKFTS